MKEIENDRTKQQRARPFTTKAADFEYPDYSPERRRALIQTRRSILRKLLQKMPRKHGYGAEEPLRS
jgi:hypothetical protein